MQADAARDVVGRKQRRSDEAKAGMDGSGDG